MNNHVAPADKVVINKIYIVRGQKVMIDRDLAELYGVETKVLKQTVRRNPRRFPADFMFEMSKEELSVWRSQFVTSKLFDYLRQFVDQHKKPRRVIGFKPTESGITDIKPEHPATLRLK